MPAQAKLLAFDPQVTALLAQMTLDEKIGQMTQAEQGELSKDLNDVDGLFLGSVFSGGNSDPTPENTLKDWTDMYDRLQGAALRTRLKIPILFGVDAVHGHSNVVGATIFPHNIALGATRDREARRGDHRLTAQEVRASGIQLVLRAVRDRAAGRSLGPRPTRASARIRRWSPSSAPPRSAASRARTCSDPLPSCACAKHFVGDGGTTRERAGRMDKGALDQGDTRSTEGDAREFTARATSRRRGRRRDDHAVLQLVERREGVGERQLLTDVLKRELGLQGFLISDYNASTTIPGDFRSAIKISINAGMDMVMVPTNYKEFSRLSRAREGRPRADGAHRRRGRAHPAREVRDGPDGPGKRNQLADRSLQASFGSAEHRAVARQAVRESLVLLKNDTDALPIAATAKRIHVAGDGADDIGIQSGGWTITWQGKAGPITTGHDDARRRIKAAAGRARRSPIAADGIGRGRRGRRSSWSSANGRTRRCSATARSRDQQGRPRRARRGEGVGVPGRRRAVRAGR